MSTIPGKALCVCFEEGDAELITGRATKRTQVSALFALLGYDMVLILNYIIQPNMDFELI